MLFCCLRQIADFLITKPRPFLSFRKGGAQVKMKANPKGETSSPTNMALTKVQKQKILDDLKEKIAKQKAMVFVDFTGLKVKDLSNLRKKLKESDNELKVAKKTLLALALKNAGLKIEVKKIKGEIALVFGYKNEISPAQTVYQFAEANPNLKILGGILENKLIDAEKIIELAKLPTREELLAGLVGSIFAPVTNLVNVLQGNIKGLLYVLAKAKI